MQYKNMTPHTIKLNCGIEFPPCGSIVRINDEYHVEDIIDINQGHRYSFAHYSVESNISINDLPAECPGVNYIVSGAVLKAIKDNQIKRYDFVAPATGHSTCIRDSKGQVISVPGFIINIEN